MLKKIRHLLETIFTQVILHLMYLLAIGPTAVVAKLFGKKFLPINGNKSSWQIKKESRLSLKKNLSKMY